MKSVDRTPQLLYLAAFLKNANFAGSISVPFFLHRGGLSYQEFFLLEAVFSAGILLFEIPGGRVADVLGKRLSISAGFFLSALSFLLFGLFQSFSLFLLAEIIGSAGFALVSGADQALLYESLRNHPGENTSRTGFSRFEIARSLGMVLALPAGSLLLTLESENPTQALRIPFFVTSAFFLSGSVLPLFMKEDHFPAPHTPSLYLDFSGIRSILRNDRLRLFAFHSSMISAALFFIFWFYQSLLEAKGVPFHWNGFVGAGMNLSGIFLIFLLPRLEKWFGVSLLLNLSAFLPGFLLVVLIFLPDLSILLPVILLIAGILQVRRPVLSDYLNRNAVHLHRATILSGISFLERLFILLLYIIAGPIADRSLSAALLFIGAITIVFAILTRTESRHFEDSTGEPESTGGPKIRL